MDCPAEERLVRMALADTTEVVGLAFDLPARIVTVTHTGPVAPLLLRLAPLGLGERLLDAAPAVAGAAPAADPARERRALWAVLAINAAMFVIELAAGLVAQSTGLVADSLDMFADAAVYGVSLYAVGRSALAQGRAARLAGVLQLLLGLGALAEVARRALTGSAPEAPLMMGVAALALAANAACLVILARHREGGAHLRASWIFTTTDVIANAGVILAGLLVAVTGMRVFDLVVGVLIAGLVLRGAWRILRLKS
jgi:cation diffusion facilitator family transporter